MTGDVRARAQRWLVEEPDEDLRAEMRALLNGQPDELAERMSGRLTFGTAGLRAAIGAGPLRMNRLVVRQAAAGLGRWLRASGARGPVVVGYDARHKSDAFARDTARVLAAQGFDVERFDTVVPTPMLAWAITERGACAGVMVTASHNPPADNGYKVYLASGSQIVSPVDVEIAAEIARLDPWDVELADADDPRIRLLGADVRARYVSFAATAPLRATPGVRVAYTAMHGVGGATMLAACRAAGYPEPVVVAEQQQPDPDFPTVSFPNPEEPGAMDLVIALAQREGVTLAIANDPDADRMAVAIPDGDGRWRRLGGDEVGWILADHILAHTSGDDRLVVTTLVSSSMLGRLAEDHGVHYAETFTGFKWIAHTALEHPQWRFAYGYEQALGYLVAPRPLDKDGITAALMIIEVAATLAAAGSSIAERLEQLAERYGRYDMVESAVHLAPERGAEVVARLRAEPPTRVGDRAVTEVTWFEEAGLLRLQCGDALRVQVRPSGTEPKVKLYAQGIDVDAHAALGALEAVVVELGSSGG